MKNKMKMKVKTFYVCNDTTNLEQLINDWIVETKPLIKIVTQCSSGTIDHHVTTTIFYEDGQQPLVMQRSELLFAFITEVKKEFADQNWDYLDFIAERVLKANNSH